MSIMLIAVVVMVIVVAFVAVALKGRQSGPDVDEPKGGFTFLLETRPYFFSQA